MLSGEALDLHTVYRAALSLWRLCGYQGTRVLDWYYEWKEAHLSYVWLLYLAILGLALLPSDRWNKVHAVARWFTVGVEVCLWCAVLSASIVDYQFLREREEPLSLLPSLWMARLRVWWSHSRPVGASLGLWGDGLFLFTAATLAQHAWLVRTWAAGRWTRFKSVYARAARSVLEPSSATLAATSHDAPKQEEESEDDRLWREELENRLLLGLGEWRGCREALLSTYLTWMGQLIDFRESTQHAQRLQLVHDMQVGERAFWRFFLHYRLQASDAIRDLDEACRRGQTSKPYNPLIQGLFMIGLETLLDTHHARAVMGIPSPEDTLSGHTDHLSLILQRFRNTAQRYKDATAEPGQDDTARPCDAPPASQVLY